MNVRNRDFFVYDNLFVLEGMDSESVDLIYLDPPFNTEKEQKGSAHETTRERRKKKILGFFEYLKNRDLDIGVDLEWKEEYDAPSFKDRWDGEKDERNATIFHENIRGAHSKLYSYLEWVKGSCPSAVFNYLAFMAIRIVEMHRVLKPTGSLYLHCDQKMAHFLKLVLDFVFGERNFRNEIVWHYFMGTKSAKYYGKKHDTIFFYTKTESYTYRVLPKIRRLDFKPSLANPFSVNKYEIGDTGKDELGYYSVVKMDDVWDIKGVFNMSKQYTGYPTQKPLALLERIIAASTNEGDIVLDPFAGCATTCVAAENLNRKWIGIDVLTISYLFMLYRIWKSKTARDSIQEWLPRYRAKVSLRNRGFLTK